MANPLLTRVASLVLRLFGKDLLVASTDLISSQFQRVFAARNVLILGPRQVGKSSLALLLTTKRPFRVVDGERRSPDPTAAVAIVDRKFQAQKGNWLKLKEDLPGDEGLRATWVSALDEIRPHGILWMVDGRREGEALDAQLRPLFEQVLTRYREGLGNLQAVHVLLNFSDQWAVSISQRRARVQDALGRLDALREGAPHLEPLRMGVSAIQLSPAADRWDDVQRAIHHFGADLLG